MKKWIRESDYREKLEMRKREDKDGIKMSNMGEWNGYAFVINLEMAFFWENYMFSLGNL